MLDSTLSKCIVTHRTHASVGFNSLVFRVYRMQIRLSTTSNERQTTNVERRLKNAEQARPDDHDVDHWYPHSE